MSWQRSTRPPVAEADAPPAQSLEGEERSHDYSAVASYTTHIFIVPAEIPLFLYANFNCTVTHGGEGGVGLTRSYQRLIAKQSSS